MKAKIEKISAITLKVTDMEASVRFYRDVLGLELLGERYFHVHDPYGHELSFARPL